MDSFSLDDRLAGDTLPLCQTSTSLLRVIRDGRFAWTVLVPARPGLADLVDLQAHDEASVMADMRAASLALREATGCDKLNVASLGNMVRQLHIHIIARFEGDSAWPGPVWDGKPAEVFDDLPDWSVKVRDALLAQGWKREGGRHEW